MTSPSPSVGDVPVSQADPKQGNGVLPVIGYSFSEQYVFHLTYSFSSAHAGRQWHPE